MAKHKATAEHCAIRNGNLFCSNCGEEQKIKYPIDVKSFSAMSQAFTELYKSCPKIWKQPVVDQRLTEKEKATWWFNHGERGVSSETIFQIIDGRTIHDFSYRTSHPSDPDDFRRCYLLLKTIPEWKEKLHMMKKVSPVWEVLVDNWDRLSEMLEEQMRTGKPNGMYELMKDLGA
ncbi:MAG: hypothetical protein RDU14_16960 [Melioribacteraceae bacterium]|nr:hypothetical protein [Melioribacteraceae bacterium]